MEVYNRYQHCGETFYTGEKIKQIICSECGEEINFNETITTKKPITKQENVDPVKVFNEQ